MIDIREHGGNFGGSSGGIKIKSIQKGIEVFNSNDSFRNITINPVDVNNAVVRIRVMTSVASEVHWFFEGYLTNSTTLRLARNAVTPNEIRVEWEIVEYEGKVKIQKGRYFKSSSASAEWFDITISPVNVNRSIIAFSSTTNWNDSPQVNEIIAYFVNETTLRLHRNAVSLDIRYIPWYVVEFL